MDATDKKLLRLLQQNSKQTHKALSLELGLSPTAVYERIKRLERQGIIRKYVALLDPSRVERNFRVFCQVKLNQHIKNQVISFEKEVGELEEGSAVIILGVNTITFLKSVSGTCRNIVSSWWPSLPPYNILGVPIAPS